MPRKIEISHKTVIFTLLLLAGVWLLYFLRQIILQVFVALLIMTIVNPLVRRLQRFKIPRAVSILVIYLLILGFLSLVVGLILPPLFEQTKNFAVSIPEYLGNIDTPFFKGSEIAAQLAQDLGAIPSQAVKVGVSFFSNILSVVTVFVFAFYLLLQRNKLDDQLSNLVGEENSKRIARVIDNLELKLGGWARAELILMTIVGTLSYIGFLALGIPFALPLAILAGLLETVPTLGPILGAIPAVIVGFGVSQFAGFGVAILAFFIQQLENYVIVPKVMQDSVGVSPIVTLFALIVGFKIAGVVGAILAVPTVITLEVLGKEFFFEKD